MFTYVYSLKRVQRLPMTMEQAWNFFSSPENLKIITPSYMGFQTTSEALEVAGGRMYAGQIITYKVRPLLGIPLFWMTEITHVREGEYFVDEQRIGPYRMWHHQHHFKAVNGGVEMTDQVYYRLPLGILGAIANTLFVKRQLAGIFNYRFQKLEEMFGTMPEQSAQLFV